MYKQIILFLGLTISGSTFAQNKLLDDYIKIQKEVLCHNKEDIFKELSAPDIKEKPVWVGKDPHGKTDFILLVNERKNTFTIVQAAESIACIIGIGTGNFKGNLIKTNQ